MEEQLAGTGAGEAAGEQGEDLTETQLLSTGSRTWQHSRNREFSPVHSRNREFSPSELLHSRSGDELGRFVAQGSPGRNSVGSSQSTQSLGWHWAELLTREETHTCQGDLWGTEMEREK